MVAALWDNNGNDTTNGSPSFLIWSNATLGTTQIFTRAVSVNEQAYTYSDCDLYYLWNPSPGHGLCVRDGPLYRINADHDVHTDLYSCRRWHDRGSVRCRQRQCHRLKPFGLHPVQHGEWLLGQRVMSVNYNGGTGNSMTNTASSGGAVGFNFQPAPGGNVLQMAMGYVTNLSGGVSTITAGASGVPTHMAMAAMVFPPVSGTATPTNVTAAGQLNQVVLSWADASGGAATNYTICRSTSSGGAYSAIGTNNGNTNTNYTDTAVTDWTTYYYEVTASGPGGASLFSFPPASATPVGLPTVPSGLSAIPGNTQVVLNWNTQAGATNFNVLRSITSGSGFTTIASVTATSYMDTGLVNGTTYYYELNATNRFGMSANSAQISAIPSAPNAHIVVNASNAVRTADTRWFGINASVYCPDFNLQDGVPEVTKAGWTTLRFPGGSIADNYHWYIPNSVAPDTTYATFAKVATNLGATVFITANYGSGTAAEAAAWVGDANVTNHYGFKYWEIGNEEYGTYETDNHANPHDPYTYATNAAAYIQQMKAVDPTIKVGVIITSPLDPTYGSNGYNSHPATNLVTGQVYYGWTPVVMSTLRQLGVTPDFAIEHYYPEDYPYVGDNDQALLAGTISTDSGGTWATNAWGLRQQITQFFGPGGTNIELVLTENNSEEGTVGKQSVSLVNALYYADSLGQIMQTEFNARVWWDYSDAGPSTSGDLNTNVYGWRMYGDLGTMMPGIAEPLTNRYPQYFAAELVSHFAGGGDTVVKTTSDLPLVSAYGALRTNGSLTLLAINKSPTNYYLAGIILTNYIPIGTATLYSYGMPQDNAAKNANNAACDVAQSIILGVGPNVDYPLAPYSMNVFVFAPSPSLSILPLPGAGPLVLQLAGEPDVPYVLQTSTNLTDWTSVATNTLTSNVLDVTNPISSGTGAQFWRAAWLP